MNSITGIGVTSPGMQSANLMSPAQFMLQMSRTMLDEASSNGDPMRKMFGLGGGALGAGLGMALGGPMGGALGGAVGGALGGLVGATTGALGQLGSGAVGGSFTHGSLNNLGNLKNVSVDTLFMIIMGERQKALGDVLRQQMSDYRFKTQQIKQINQQLQGLRQQSANIGQASGALKSLTGALSMIPGVGQIAGAVAGIAGQATDSAKQQIDNKIEALKDKRTELMSEQQQEMMRIQDTMSKFSKAAETATNVMKKYSDTMSGIVNNIK